MLNCNGASRGESVTGASGGGVARATLPDRSMIRATRFSRHTRQNKGVSGCPGSTSSSLRIRQRSSGRYAPLRRYLAPSKRPTAEGKAPGSGHASRPYNLPSGATKSPSGSQVAKGTQSNSSTGNGPHWHAVSASATQPKSTASPSELGTQFSDAVSSSQCLQGMSSKAGRSSVRATALGSTTLAGS